jgi:uncharacterized protein (DUF488 family)
MILFTIGYEGRSLPQFLEDLGKAGVRQLVDVREAPISRKRGFSKYDLAEALDSTGISYRHIRALGCPKTIRDRFKLDGDWSRYTQEFMAHLAHQQPGLEELRALVVSGPTAVVCYEADFNHCHRTYVARSVAHPTGARICHITPAGLIDDAA